MINLLKCKLDKLSLLINYYSRYFALFLKTICSCGNNCSYDFIIMTNTDN